ncbi:MAG TPA: efflux RND transporter periplasmic adaptor subunit [Terriglobia bacterium]|nr:efflux RND transporter periplasmic adaptor subunit [Terriglobia bacterium]
MDHLSNELSKLKIDASERGDQPSSRKRLFVVIVVIAVILAGIYAVFALRNSTAGAEVETVRPRVQSASSSAVLVATGYVVAHHKIQVGSKIAGRVAWIGVEKGNRVRQGQAVVRLEDREYRAQLDQDKAALQAAEARLNELQRGSRPEEVERAKHDVERAEAQLRSEEANLKRTEGLVKEGVFPPQSLDDANGRTDSARANLASLGRTHELIRQGPRREQIDNARAEVERARAAVNYAQTILDATEIKAPIGGTILERNVEQGEMVTTSFVGDRGAKSFVVTLADLNDLQVELDINQNDFNRIGPNQPCAMITDAFPDRPYKCHVDEIAPEANRQKATVQVKVKVLEPDEYVRPEMNARVTFMNTEEKQEKGETTLYIVPKRSVVEREGEKRVAVIVDGKVQTKPVKVEREVGSDVYISAGLSGNESVIVSEPEKLKTGDRVEGKK